VKNHQLVIIRLAVRRVKSNFLCKEMHHTYLCSRMDEASYLLEKIVNVQQQLPTAYRKLSLNLPLVDELVNLVPSSINLVD
jgi:hypothetical protein